jgi:hypothetical protein
MNDQWMLIYISVLHHRSNTVTSIQGTATYTVLKIHQETNGEIILHLTYNKTYLHISLDTCPILLTEEKTIHVRVLFLVHKRKQTKYQYFSDIKRHTVHIQYNGA